MNYYQEISLLPTTDIGVFFLWQKVYQQLHLALVEYKMDKNASAIGIAFPEHEIGKHSLGVRLRLFAQDQRNLEQMQCDKWLNRLKDYVHIHPVKPVPEKVIGHACFKHKKLKGNKEKLARRRVKRKGETLEKAMAHYEGYIEQRSKLPYINMISQTNGQRFKLFIEMQEKDEPQMGSYSCYGLSNSATVPLF